MYYPMSPVCDCQSGLIKAIIIIKFFITSGVKIPRVKSKVKSKRKAEVVTPRRETNCCGVKALNSYRNALEKKAGLSVVS